jgi:hypothetical protein
MTMYSFFLQLAGIRATPGAGRCLEPWLSDIGRQLTLVVN